MRISDKGGRLAYLPRGGQLEIFSFLGEVDEKAVLICLPQVVKEGGHDGRLGKNLEIRVRSVGMNIFPNWFFHKLDEEGLVMLLEQFVGEIRPRDPLRIFHQNRDLFPLGVGIALFPFDESSETLSFPSEFQPPGAEEAVNMNLPFQITAKGREDGGDGGEESLFLATGEEGFHARGKDRVQPGAFLEKQGPELRWNRKGDREVWTVWKQAVHVRPPLVHLDFGAHRTGFYRTAGRGIPPPDDQDRRTWRSRGPRAPGNS